MGKGAAIAMISAALALPACDKPAQRPPSDEPGTGSATEQSLETGRNHTKVQGAWEFQTLSDVEAQLTFRRRSGTLLLHMICRPDPAMLHVEAQLPPRFDDESLIFIMDGRPVTLTIDAVGDSADSVAGAIPLTPQLAVAIAAAETFDLSYGAQSIGPVDAPEQRLSAHFSTSCQAALNSDSAAAEREQIEVGKAAEPPP